MDYLYGGTVLSHLIILKGDCLRKNGVTKQNWQLLSNLEFDSFPSFKIVYTVDAQATLLPFTLVLFYRWSAIRSPFYVYQYGDLSDGCTRLGPHYNPEDVFLNS